MLGWKGCRKGSHTHYQRQHCVLLLRAPDSLCWNRSPTTLGKLREWMMNEPGAQPRRDVPQTSHSRGQSPALVLENPLPRPAAATRCRWAPTERGSVASGPSPRSVLRSSGGRGPGTPIRRSAEPAGPANGRGPTTERRPVSPQTRHAAHPGPVNRPPRRPPALTVMLQWMRTGPGGGPREAEPPALAPAPGTNSQLISSGQALPMRNRSWPRWKMDSSSRSSRFRSRPAGAAASPAPLRPAPPAAACDPAASSAPARCIFPWRDPLRPDGPGPRRRPRSRPKMAAGWPRAPEVTPPAASGRGGGNGRKRLHERRGCAERRK